MLLFKVTSKFLEIASGETTCYEDSYFAGVLFCLLVLGGLGFLLNVSCVFINYKLLVGHKPLNF